MIYVLDVCRALSLLFAGYELAKYNLFACFGLIVFSMVFHICQAYIPEKDTKEC